MSDRKTILLVEDEALIRLAATKTLEKAGYIVIGANSGEKALEIAQNGHSIDLILMDINLGKGMDGTEAAREILKDHNIPVVFLSSHTEEEVVEKTEKITSFGYVVKASGDTVLKASIKMAFKLHKAYTELNSTKDILRINERKYRRLFEAAKDGILILSVDTGLITDSNPFLTQLLGYGPDELIGKYLWDISPFRDIAANEEAFLELSQKEYMRYDDLPLETRDGRHVDVEFVSNVYSVGEGKAIQCNIRDITGHKIGARALRESEERYRGLSEDMPAYVGVFLPDSTLTYVNAALAEMAGMRAEEMIGLRFFDMVPPDTRVAIRGWLASLTPENPTETHEQFYSAPDGNPHWQQWTNRAFFDDHARVIRYQAVGMDITDRKLAEDKVKSLLSERELLLREVHHRIKNNMNTIMSLLSLQSSILKNNPSGVAALQDAKGRVQSMMVLYDKLYRSPDFRALSTKDYLTSLIDEIVINFPNRERVTIEKQIDDLTLDATTLSPVGMILNELLTNAMKHAFHGRDNGKVSVSFSVKDTHATLLVEDNGVGISESIDIASSPGFGLQVVGILTEQLEGSVRLERNKGATFILEFDV